MRHWIQNVSTRAAAAGLGVLAAVTLPARALAQEEDSATEVSYAENALLFETSERNWTVGEFEDYARLVPPRPLQERTTISLDLDAWSEERVRAGIEEVVLVREAASRARTEELELSPEKQNRFDHDLESIQTRVWLVETGVLDDRKVTDEEITAYYEQHQEEKYTIHEQLTLRHVFLSTYETHVVEEGESLESIAEKISGDPELADRILDAETKKPRIEGSVNHEGDEMPPQALSAGETLLVPMNAQRVAEVGERAQEIWARLEAGEEFKTVATTMSENETPGRLVSISPKRDGKPVNEDMKKAFLELEDGTFSKPFRTKHGWQIIFRHKYIPESLVPLDRVEARIRNAVINDGRRERYEALMREILTDYPSLAVNDEVLAIAEEPSSADQVIFQMRDVKYTGANFARDFGDRVTPETSLEDRRMLLAETSVLQRVLGEWDRERKDVSETELYKSTAKRIADMHYANQWIEHRMETAELNVTEELISAKYEELKDILKTQPAADISQITLRINVPDDATNLRRQEALADASNELRSELLKVETSEEFAVLAKQISEDEYAETGGKIGKVQGSYMNGLVGRAINESGAQNFHGPFDTPESDGVRAIWLNSVNEAQQATLEEARDDLETAVLRDLRTEYGEDLRARVVEGMELVVHIPPLDQ